MNRPQPPARVPTLTEVIALGAEDEAPAVDRAGASAEASATEADDVEPQDVDRLLAGLKPWLDAEWERRVRAALDPAWQSLHDALLLRLRAEFESLLEEALRRALPQARPPEGRG